MKKRGRLRLLLLPLTIAMMLYLTACTGKDNKASSMWLVKTEGTVGVTDGNGENVSFTGRLGLYNGYGVNTAPSSYGWINLDDTKLTKMDESSKVTINKDGKNLSLLVEKGSLYFDVTKPLSDDETMEIRTSNLVTGIRGTEGWVTQDTVCLLEGTVTVSDGSQEISISAGEMAYYTEDSKIDVRALTPDDVPEYVTAEKEGENADLFGSGDKYESFVNKLSDVVCYEVIDFENDGNPELMVISGQLKENLDYPDNPGRLYIKFYRENEDGFTEVGSRFLEGGSKSKCSLVEAGGRKYLRLYTVAGHSGYASIKCEFAGSVAEADGLTPDWIMIDLYQVVYNDGNINISIDEYSQDTKEYDAYSADRSLIDALENKYTFILDLLVTDGAEIKVIDPNVTEPIDITESGFEADNPAQIITDYMLEDSNGGYTLPDIDDTSYSDAVADLKALYQELKNNSPRFPIRFKEIIDFEGDGTPELMVISGTLKENDESHGSLRISIYYIDSTGAVEIRDFSWGCWTESACSLLEADGRKYIRVTDVRNNKCLISYIDLPTVADRNVKKQDMIVRYTCEIEYANDGSVRNVVIGEYSSDVNDLYLKNEGTNLSAAEAIEYKYTFLRDLVVTEGANIIVESE